MDIIVGASTEVISGEGKIVTAGAVDTHVHFISPQQIEKALASGVTTMVGGGTVPATGSSAANCTPGPRHISRMLQSFEAFPMNFVLSGKGSSSRPEAPVEQIEAGVACLKMHEDREGHAGGPRLPPVGGGRL